MVLLERLRGVAAEHEARLGVTDLAPFPEVRAEIERRRATGASGRLGFTFKDPAMSAEPARSFPWARSIVVVAVPYLRDGDGRSPDRPVARFADGDRYAPVRAVLDDLITVLAAGGARGEPVLDDDRIVDRAVAVRSGIAWWGKSTMALAPGLGPWFLIGSVVTDEPLPVGEPMVRSCGTCDACLPACPTGAIVAPGMLDARRCIAAVLQGRGTIPEAMRVAVGRRVYGCDDCLTACPPGDPALDSHLPVPQPDPRRLLTASDEELERMTSHWYVPGRKMRFVRRNALVAVGNDRRGDDVALLVRFLHDPDSLLRSHAAWALGRIGTDHAREALRDAADRERDPEVAAEIAGASAMTSSP